MEKFDLNNYKKNICFIGGTKDERIKATVFIKDNFGIIFDKYYFSSSETDFKGDVHNTVFVDLDNNNGRIIDAVMNSFGAERCSYTNGLEEYGCVILKNLNAIHVPSTGNLFFIVLNSIDKDGDFKVYTTLEETAVFVKNPLKPNLFLILMCNNQDNTSNTFKTNHHRAYACSELKCLSYIVGKNGCSSIVAQFFRFKEPNTPEDWIPWYPNSNFNLVERAGIKLDSFDEIHSKYNDYRKFICVRDPVSRFISIVNFSYNHKDVIGYPYNNSNLKIEDKNLYIDYILSICKGMFMIDDPYYKDEHYMTQIEQLNNVDFDSVDDFVELRDLDKYFKQVYNIELKRSNESKVKFITKEDLSEQQISRIKEIFKKDYDFLNKIKLWEPTKDD